MSVLKESAFLSECGSTRKINQDAVFVSEADGLSVYLLADGMGGHTDGELASQGVAAAVKAWMTEREAGEEPSWEDSLRSLADILQKENDHIFESLNVEGRICGTTLVLLLATDERYAVFTIGDSRLYRLERRRVVQMSTDDVWETDPVQTAGLSEDEILHHPNRGKLLRAFGTSRELFLHRQTGPLAEGMVFLLCSDGIYKYCDSRTLAKALKKAKKGGIKIKESLLILEKKVLENGSKDNYSAIIVRTG